MSICIHILRRVQIIFDQKIVIEMFHNMRLTISIIFSSEKTNWLNISYNILLVVDTLPKEIPNLAAQLLVLKQSFPEFYYTLLNSVAYFFTSSVFELWHINSQIGEKY